jgi:hypothetical protein
MAQFVTIPTIDGEIADVNLEMITHMPLVQSLTKSGAVSAYVVLHGF